MPDSHVLFIGGPSGLGKSTVAFALHDLLADLNVRHAVIEGDALDMAHPAPWKQHLAERNLAAIWSNYRDLGYHRLIYTNTVSVLEPDALAAAMGDAPETTSVLLRASEETVSARLGQREHGESLERHLQRSIESASRLEDRAPSTVHRMDTDGQTPVEIAERILAIVGWNSED
ncbi:MAG: adenylyl-sulfate kinase [Microbacterium sp.]